MTDSESPDRLTPPGPPIEPVAPETTATSDRAAPRPRTVTWDGPANSPYSRTFEIPPSKTMAGWALALSLLICIPFVPIIGTALAIAVLVRSADGRDHGKVRAIAALVISGLYYGVIVVMVVIGAVDGFLNGFDEAQRNSEGEVTEAGLVTTDRLRVGDCFDDQVVMDAPSDSTEIDSSGQVLVKPCDEPHQFETIHIVEIDAEKFPGNDAVHGYAGQCLDEWKPYLGERYRARGAYELSYYYPTSLSWRLGDRRVVCNVYARDESELTGSVRAR